MGLKLHVLDLGRVRHDINFAVPFTVAATVSAPNPPSQLIDIPISAYLIEHSNGNVLFDTGCHPQGMGPNGLWPQDYQKLFPYTVTEECQLPNQLAALGLGPDQIRYVVLSHLHNDHAGCAEFFRKSKVIVHEDEFSGALKHYALHDQSTPYIWKHIDNWIKNPLDWRLVGRDELDQTLVENVRLINLGVGHAYGMLALEISLRSRPKVLLVSDACYNASNYGPPVRAPGFMYDSMGFYRTIERIRWMARETGAEVWFGHDLQQFGTLVKATQGFYE
jgi:glyoxylase-like metal-dependent hydrolase (beta-lactamase superfamily II)